MGVGHGVHLDTRLNREDGQEISVSLTATDVKDAEDDTTGLVLHFIDTTEHKNLEIQFTQSQKMQAVGQLAGGVAHDFNNLLTAMIGFSDLLLARRGPDDPDFADIMQIKQNANRATNLVRQLLAFSRKQKLEPEIVDVSEMLGDLSNLLGRLIGERVDLQMDHGRDLGVVLFDKGQFDQVIINLCVNARDAMPDGGKITIATRAVTFKQPTPKGHEIIPAGKYVSISVSDTGTGIAKENLDRIFEPFFSTKEVGAGTGLAYRRFTESFIKPMAMCWSRAPWARGRRSSCICRFRMWTLHPWTRLPLPHLSKRVILRGRAQCCWSRMKTQSACSVRVHYATKVTRSSRRPMVRRP